MTFVNRSLSRGLADKFLAEIHDREMVHLDRRATLVTQHVGKRGDVKRLAEALIAVGEECSFTQIIASHAKWRWASISVFIPTLVAIPSFGPNHRFLCFGLFRTSIHAGRDPDFDPGYQVTLAISEHAIERLFQRMNVISSEAVEDELHESMCMSIAALAVCKRTGLKQLVLPTKLGMFLCEVSEDQPNIIAKSWVANTTISLQQAAAGKALRSLYEAIGGQNGVAEYLATLPISARHLSIPLPDHSCEYFEKSVWMKEKYSEREDPVGETWRLARAQAGQSSDSEGS